MEPKAPSKMKAQLMGSINNIMVIKVSIVLLLLLVLAIVGGYLIYRPNDVKNVLRGGSSYYTVVFDCGSTGTRVNVYEWMVGIGGSDENLPVLIHTYPDNLTKSDGCQYHCMQTEPGLDKFVRNATGVRQSLKPLFYWAEQWVPMGRRWETPVFVLATAGMRKLVEEDARRVLDDVEDVVMEHDFLYRKSWIRVLSGREEAYYGWAALNYETGVLSNSSRTSTLGLLDLGGSSLQVVAEVDGSPEDEGLIISQIGSFEHRLGAYSLPAFGLNEAFDRTIVMLSHSQALRESAGGAFEVSHPCLGSSFSQNYACRGCFGLNSSDSILLKSPVKTNEVSSILLLGNPDWGKCKALVRAAASNASGLESSHQEDNSSCIFYGGNRLLNLTRHSQSVSRYHALSAFVAVYNMLNLTQRGNVTKMWERGEHLCTTVWTDQTSTDCQYCFRAAYMTSLIEDALCLGTVEIIFGPGDISWTLGAALVEGEYLWNNITNSQTQFSQLNIKEVMGSPFIIFTLLCCLMLVVYCSQIKLPMPGRKASSGRSSLPSYLGGPKRQP